jgi:two-component system LytT family response regulator
VTARLSALVVDDETLARRRLARLLRREPDVEIVGECRDGAEAVAVIEAEHPDLVFLDVQMPELDGFEVLDALDLARPPVVVFVTAYDQYALRAFDANALDYLLKPFEDERFQETLRRAREYLEGQRTRGDQATRLRALVEARRAERPFLTRIAVRAQGRVVFLPVGDIEWLEAADNYVRLHTGAGAFLIRETMAAVETRLDPGQFLRIHRSAIVNLNRITEVQPWFHGEHVVVLRHGTRLRSSRTYAPELKRMLRNAP